MRATAKKAKTAIKGKKKAPLNTKSKSGKSSGRAATAEQDSSLFLSPEVNRKINLKENPMPKNGRSTLR